MHAYPPGPHPPGPSLPSPRLLWRPSSSARAAHSVLNDGIVLLALAGTERLGNPRGRAPTLVKTLVRECRVCFAALAAHHL